MRFPRPVHLRRRPSEFCASLARRRSAWRQEPCPLSASQQAFLAARSGRPARVAGARADLRASLGLRAALRPQPWTFECAGKGGSKRRGGSGRDPRSGVAARGRCRRG
eukprot:7907147-Pyramimonas_sp.AAC.1